MFRASWDALWTLNKQNYSTTLAVKGAQSGSHDLYKLHTFYILDTMLIIVFNLQMLIMYAIWYDIQ